MLLQLKNITLKLQAKTIINNVNLGVDKNAFLTLSGPSGSGKSTLLKLIANLINPTSGKILFKNKNINEYNPTIYRQQVSYCFQQPALFGNSVKDNLEFPFIVRKEAFNQQKAISALNKVSLDESYLTKPINKLSGGEKQRVALLRNTMFKPDILLLDEVTTGLDEANKHIVHQFINNIHNQDTTIIQVTHDSDELKTAQHTIIITKGAISDEKFSR